MSERNEEKSLNETRKMLKYKEKKVSLLQEKKCKFTETVIEKKQSQNKSGKKVE